MTELLTRFGEAFAVSGVTALAAAFTWGILSVALSPCHLSSVPLVVAYMSGGEELPTRRRWVCLSSAFAAGVLLLGFGLYFSWRTVAEFVSGAWIP